MLRALVAFDGSPDAISAIGVAAALLKPVEAIVLHVRGVPPADVDALAEVRRGQPLDEVMKARESRAAAASRALADEGAQLARAAGWRAEGASALAYGGVWDEILNAAREPGTEVVVIGRRGLTGAAAALGSVSDAVVHGARQPVLVVPRGDQGAAAVAGAGPALVAYDGSDGARAALGAATGLIGDRELLICHVGGDRHPPDPADDPVIGEAVDLAHAAGCRARGVPGPGIGVAPGLSGRAWRAIAAVAREHEAAVVAVGSRGRSAAKELALGSVAMGVLHHAERPVIAAPPAPG